MQYTADYIDSMLTQADKAGKDQRELENISKQLAELVSQGTFSMRKMYKQPLSDVILRPLGEASKVIVKEHINKDIYKNTLSYEYTFTYKRGDEFDE